MFGKKKPPPLPFVLQVLTLDYLIEGTAPGDTHLNFPESNLPLTLHMTSVRIQPAQALELPVRSLEKFAVAAITAVAFIPGAELDRLPQASIWKDYYRTPLQSRF